MKELPEAEGVVCLGISDVWMEMPLCEVITDAVKEYLDSHDCPILDVGYRYNELNSIIYRLLEKKRIPWLTRVTRTMSKEEAITAWRLLIRCYGLEWTGPPRGWQWIHYPSREARDCWEEINRVLTPDERRAAHLELRLDTEQR